MVEDFPGIRVPFPDGAAASGARPLKESVGDEEGICGEFCAVEVLDFPRVSDRRVVALLERFENERAAVAAAGSADFPKIGSGHFLEVGASHAKLWTMEERFAAHEFAGDLGEVRRRTEAWLHIGALRKIVR